jgi:hypothetical protein
MYVGLDKAQDLPAASTMCNQCGVVCPVRIPLPDLQRKLRDKAFETGLRPWYERAGFALWSFAAQRPALYGFGSKLAVRLLKAWGGRDGLIHKLPIGSGWTEGRDLPAPAGKTFRELYRAKAQGRFRERRAQRASRFRRRVAPSRWYRERARRARRSQRARARGKDIVSFCIGQPDFPTPVNVQDGVAAIRAGSTATRRRPVSTSYARPRRRTSARAAST